MPTRNRDRVPPACNVVARPLFFWVIICILSIGSSHLSNLLKIVWRIRLGCLREKAQDDGYVAKILVEAGSGEITVGTPVMVTVEEEEDIAAFANFVPPEAEAAPAPAAEEPAPAAAAAAAPEPTPATPVVEAAPAPPTPPTAAAPPAPEPVAAPPAPAVAATVGSAPTVGPAWGGLARVASPIAKTLSSEQKEYIAKYGTTGQVPL